MADDLEHELFVLAQELKFKDVYELGQSLTVPLVVSNHQIQNYQDLVIQVIQFLSSDLVANVLVSVENKFVSEICPETVGLEWFLAELFWHGLVVDELQCVGKQFNQKMLLQLALDHLETLFALFLCRLKYLTNVRKLAHHVFDLFCQLCLAFDGLLVAEAQVVYCFKTWRRFTHAPVIQVVVKVLDRGGVPQCLKSHHRLFFGNKFDLEDHLWFTFFTSQLLGTSNDADD